MSEWRTLWDRAQALLTCAVDELDAMAAGRTDVKGAPDLRFVAPGASVADDNCCEDGGQLWVRVVRAHPVDPIPKKILEEVPCQKPIGVQLAVGVTRCAHTIDDDGGDPTADELNSDSLQMACDMAALLAAIECCDNDEERTTVDEWTPKGPAGGCHGGEWTLWWTPRIACPELEEA